MAFCDMGHYEVRTQSFPSTISLGNGNSFPVISEAGERRARGGKEAVVVVLHVRRVLPRDRISGSSGGKEEEREGGGIKEREKGG